MKDRVEKSCTAISKVLITSPPNTDLQEALGRIAPRNDVAGKYCGASG
jgi:hypothetical protein